MQYPSCVSIAILGLVDSTRWGGGAPLVSPRGGDCGDVQSPHIRGAHDLSQVGIGQLLHRSHRALPQPQTDTTRNLIKAPPAEVGLGRRSVLPPLLLCSPPRPTRDQTQQTREEDGGGDAGGRRLLRRAQQAHIAPHHRRRRGRRLRRRAVPRRHARRPAGILGRAPCAAGRVDAGATGLHVVPPRRQIRRRHQQRRQGVAAAAAVRQQGHRRVHPPVVARLGALQEEGPEVERLQRGGAQGGAGAGGGGRLRGRRRAREEACLTAAVG